MSSTFFTYICTASTSDPYIAPNTTSLAMLARDTSDAFLALTGGRTEVGQLAFYPTQRSVPNHLLCDGREVPKSAFPELYRYYGNAGGAPVDPLNFKLPNYITAFTPSTTSVAETTNQGTVSTPVPATPPPDYYVEQVDAFYGPVDSGGRWNSPL